MLFKAVLKFNFPAFSMTLEAAELGAILYGIEYGGFASNAESIEISIVGACKAEKKILGDFDSNLGAFKWDPSRNTYTVLQETEKSQAIVKMLNSKEF